MESSKLIAELRADHTDEGYMHELMREAAAALSLPTLPAADGWVSDEAEITRLREEIEALTHEGRQGELEQANVSLATENERLRGGLRWYADGHHFELPGWEDCSGESANWIFPPIETTEECWMVDDGGIACSILDHGHSINPNQDEDENITIAPLPAPPAESKGER